MGRPPADADQGGKQQDMGGRCLGGGAGTGPGVNTARTGVPRTVRLDGSQYNAFRQWRRIKALRCNRSLEPPCVPIAGMRRLHAVFFLDSM